MIRTDYTVRMLQAVAAVLGMAIVLWTSGVLGLSGTAQAAQVTSASATLSDSAPSTAANYTITFTTPSGLVDGESIELTFDPTFTLPSGGFDFNDLDVTDDGTEITLAAVAGGGGPGTWGVATATDSITITVDGASVASSSVIEIEIGTNAESGATGDNQIINPSSTTTSHAIAIGGTMQDAGEVRVAIVDAVTVTANVETVFDFTVAGVASGASVNSSPTTTATTTSPNALPFGTLVGNTSVTLAHDMTVTTNAANGFAVTVEQSGDLQSSTGATIDSFIDGAYTDTPSEWTGPSATIGDDSTYGHWGLTSDDPDFSATADRWVAASTTPVTIFQNGGPADGTQTGTGTSRIGYQVQISDLQEAGTDYSTTLTYIATPTF